MFCKKKVQVLASLNFWSLRCDFSAVFFPDFSNRKWITLERVLVCCGLSKMVDLSKFCVENPQKHQDHVSLHKEFDLKNIIVFNFSK